jgi:site-specific recombinase XerD
MAKELSKLDPLMEGYLEYMTTVERRAAGTIKDIRCTLRRVSEAMAQHHPDKPLWELKLTDFIAWLEQERRRGYSPLGLCKNVSHLRGFLDYAWRSGRTNRNVMADFFPEYRCAAKEPESLAVPRTDTVLGLRDRAMLTLLYATGIRAGECAGLIEEWVDLDERTIRVLGKGNRERVICLNARVLEALRVYRQARGPQLSREAFFRTKAGRPINRKVVYERVKKYAALAGITKRVTPHTMRHTCATHLVQHDVNLVVIRDLLGHRQITSTQIYLHTTAHDMKELAKNHPVGKLAPTIAALLEGVRLPIDHPPRRRILDRAPAASHPRASPPVRTAV